MSSKIKKLKDLERKLTVSVPVVDYDKKYSSKLSKIKSTAKLDGFRKGNVPDDVLRQRYGDSIHYEVLNELIQESYPKELQEQDIKPASSPAISIESEDPTKPISYSAVFEVFPEIKPKISRWKSFEKSEITLDDSDIEVVINDILERYCIWNKVDREAAENDQVIIDFEGKIDGDPFEGNESKDFKLILGSKSMIPGFEDHLVGKKSEDTFSFKTNFPEDYFKKDLAGKETEFFITLHEVQEMKKAAIDKELFGKLAMEGVTDEETFRSEIKKRMDGEISQQEKSLTKESIYETGAVTAEVEQAGNYYILVDNSYDTEDYSLAATYSATTGVRETEANDTVSTADNVSSGTEITGQASSISDDDYYKISLSNAGTISVTFNDGNGSNYLDPVSYTHLTLPTKRIV